MAYDLEEQDQLDALKAWWKVNSSRVTTGITILCVALIGFQGWQYYLNKQSSQASTEYELLQSYDLKDPKNTKTILALSGEMMDKLSSTPYAGRAALIAARTNYEAKDNKSAKAQLDWASKNAKEDAVKTIALLQLASIQTEEKDYDAALKTLSSQHDEAFEGLFLDLKGDVLLAQGKKPEAKQAYMDALTKLDAHGPYHRYTEHKLEATGS